MAAVVGSLDNYLSSFGTEILLQGHRVEVILVCFAETCLQHLSFTLSRVRLLSIDILECHAKELSMESIELFAVLCRTYRTR